MKKFILSICAVVMAVSTLVAQEIAPQRDEKKGLWGYVNPSTGKWVVKPKYDEAGALAKQPNGEMRALVTSKGKKGFINEAGKPVGAGVVFESIAPMQGDAMMVTVKGKTGVANYNGEWLIKPEAEKAEKLAGEGWIFSYKDKQGLANPAGAWIVEPIYKSIDTATPGYFIVDKGGKAGILNRKGETILEPKDFTSAKLAGDYWLVGKGDKYGLFDVKEKILVVKPDYAKIGDPITYQREVYVPVQKGNGKWGIVDLNGKTVVKHKYLSARTMPGIGVMLTKDGQSYIWDLVSQQLNSARSIRETKEGPFKVFSAEIGGKSFSTVSGPDGETIGFYIVSLPSYYVVYGNTETRVFDREGNQLAGVPANITDDSPLEINKWIKFKEFALSPDMQPHKATYVGKMLLAADGGSWRVIDGAPNLADVEIQDVEKCGDKHLNIKSGNKWGLFTAEGNKVFDFKLDYPVQPFEYESINGMYLSKVNDLMGLVTATGDVVMEPTADRFWLVYPNDSLLRMYNGKIEGRIDLKAAKEVIPLSRGYVDISRAIESNGANYYKVRNADDKFGLLDASFNEIFAPTYKDIDIKSGFIKCTDANGNPTYIGADLKPFTPKPKITAEFSLEHGKTKGGYNATFANYDIDFNFCEGKTYTLHVAAYLKNGKPAKHTDGYHWTVSIEPDRDSYNESSYITYSAKGFGVGYYSKQDMYMKYWLVDDATGKQVPLSGQTKFDFFSHGGGWRH